MKFCRGVTGWFVGVGSVTFRRAHIHFQQTDVAHSISHFLMAEKDVFARRQEFERSVSQSSTGSARIDR